MHNVGMSFDEIDENLAKKTLNNKFANRNQL